jgi:hypothetical protein
MNVYGEILYLALNIILVLRIYNEIENNVN